MESKPTNCFYDNNTECTSAAKSLCPVEWIENNIVKKNNRKMNS